MKPSFLAVRELKFARGRFLLMGLVVSLVSILTVLLSGLSVGLVNDGVSGLQRVPATSFAFQHDVEKSSAFSRSVVTTDEVETWRDVEGVRDASPFGNTLVNGRTDSGTEIDLALFGVERGSYMDPGADSGEALSSEGEVVISRTAADEGIEIGDTIVLDPSGQRLSVVGILDDQHTFGHVDVGYVPIRTWQEAKAGVREGDVVPERTYEEITAVAVLADGSPDLERGDEEVGTTSMTVEDSYHASPGYTAETSTLDLIQGFLYAISALVVGAFFTVLTIQRRGEIAVLRALGASSAYLVLDTLIQSFVLLVAAVGFGVAVGVGLGSAIGATEMPFALETGPIVVASALLVGLGVIGAAAAVLRITRVDPLTALGANR